MNEFWILKDQLQSRFSPKITATTQRTLTLFKGNQAGCTLFVWRILHLATFCLSVFIPPPPPVFPLHALTWQYCTSVTPPTFHDSRIDVTRVSRPDLEGTLIKQCDRLLAISFVYPAEQTSAEVESRKQSEDQCQIQSKAFYHAASITGVCHWVILHTYLIESQFCHLLKVIAMPLEQPWVCTLLVKI